MRRLLLLILLNFASNIFSMQESLDFREKLRQDPCTDKTSITFFKVARLTTNQHLFFMGENHAHNPMRVRGNTKVLELLLELMTTADQFKSDKQAFHIFIEEVIQICEGYTEREQAALDGHIMSGLMPKVKEKDYRRTQVESCENRAEYHIISMIMEMIPHPDEYIFYEESFTNQENARKYYNCDYLTLTWRDTICCFDRLMQECRKDSNKWIENKLIHDQFEIYYQKANKEFDRAKKYILKRETYSLTDDNPLILWPDESIFYFYKKHGLEYQDRLDWLSTQLRDAFSYFVDIRLLHRVLTLKKAAKVPAIIIYSGSAHSVRLYYSLKRIQSIVDESPMMYGNTFSLKEFTKIAKLLPHLHEELEEIPSVARESLLDKEKLLSILINIKSVIASRRGGILILLGGVLFSIHKTKKTDKESIPAIDGTIETTTKEADYTP